MLDEGEKKQVNEVEINIKMKETWPEKFNWKVLAPSNPVSSVEIGRKQLNYVQCLFILNNHLCCSHKMYYDEYDIMVDVKAQKNIPQSTSHLISLTLGSGCMTTIFLLAPVIMWGVKINFPKHYIRKERLKKHIHVIQQHREVLI